MSAEIKPGICGICPAGCWVRVGVEDDQLVSIAADEGHPLGMLCRRGEHAAEIVHSEHRLRYPLRRTGPKGSYEFERVSWDRAFEQITDALSRIRDESGPEAVAMYTGLEYSDSGVQAIRAVLTVFALAGQLDVPGGIGLAMRGSHFPINRSGTLPNPDVDRAVARDRFPVYSHYRGESHAVGLVDAVLQHEPYAIRGLIIHGGSILTSRPQTSIWRETLSQLDFLVSIDRQLTADAAYADIVLPATTMFEIISYMTYGPIFRIREPLIPPVGEARNDYLIMAELAQRLGYADRFPQSEEELLAYVLAGSGFTLDEVRAAGGTVKIPSPMMEYKKWEKGGLRPDGQPGFDTSSGKFEIHATFLEEHGYEPLPKYTEPSEGPLAAPGLARQFPPVFNSGARRQSFFRSQHHAVAGLLKVLKQVLEELESTVRFLACK
jgi:anaerobic selenocysteine-containing dehydrogenase